MTLPLCARCGIAVTRPASVAGRQRRFCSRACHMLFCVEDKERRGAATLARGLKKCSRCREEKPCSEFFVNSDGALSSWCKLCHTTSTKKSAALRKAKNPERWAEINLKAFLRRRYKMTLDTYKVILAGQQNCCAVCHGDNNLNTKDEQRRLYIDHDHVTGHIRGLLCHRCNVGIGLLDDNPELLRDAAAYLERPLQGAILKLAEEGR